MDVTDNRKNRNSQASGAQSLNQCQTPHKVPMLWPSPKDKWLPDIWKKEVKAARSSIKSHMSRSFHMPEDCTQYEERVDNSTISTKKFFMGSVESTPAEDEWATTLETNGAFF